MMTENDTASGGDKSWTVLPAYANSRPDQVDVPACPKCKSTKFVAAMVASSTWLTDGICCENGHASRLGELIRIHLSEAIQAEDYAGEALSHTIDVWLNQFWTEIQQSTDRAAAVLSGAMMDDLLLVLLSGLVIDKDLAAERLLKPDRPLGSFSARIDACYLLGLIDHREFQALGILRRLRNDFAHKLQNLSFEDSATADRARSLCEILQVGVPKDGVGRKIFEAATFSLWRSLSSKISLVRRVPRMPVDPTFALLMNHAAGPQSTSVSPDK